MRKDDPTEGIAGIKLPKSKGHHTWTDDEIEQYRAHWPLGTQQRLVMEFALETASRRGEVVRLGPQHVRNGRIRIERTHGSEDVDIPISPELQAACDAMPKSHLTYIVTAYGKPRSKYGLGNDFAKWATEAGLPTRCRLHGLKKSGMRRLAEAGNTAHELMAISGHKTLTEVQRYTSAADKKQLAVSGMAKMRERTKSAEITQTLAPRYTNTAKKSAIAKVDAMTWRSLGDSNPCFRRERAKLSRDEMLCPLQRIRRLLFPILVAMPGAVNQNEGGHGRPPAIGRS